MYLDPGSWGMALQVIIGSLIAIPALIAIYWGRIRVFISNKRTRKTNDKGE